MAGITNEKTREFIKLNRKAKVYKRLQMLTQAVDFSNDTTPQRIGFAASEIAESTKIARNNVSKELNCLLTEGKAVKILGRPVLYLDRVWLEKSCQIVIADPVLKDTAALQSLINREKIPKNSERQMDMTFVKADFQRAGRREKDIFTSIVGVQDDLKNQVKQAKAAMLYPPDGLHTLLIGPTGSGKTTFAEVMYRYAIEMEKLLPDAPYVVFNCADYAENSQLLISHLFGHSKGAFTGAERERRGLVDQANGGILFLDEVHRLPPEGQEMLFSLMDRGRYRRLGETENTRSARILFIAATTEDPRASILATFLRRIPLIINLPSLSERTLKGRMTLICQFFQGESVKIKLPVTVTKEVLKVLLLYTCPGNIGQLKNDIQLMCANAFVEYVTEKREYVHIKLSQLSQRMKEGFFAIDDKRQELTKNFNLNDFESITFNGAYEDVTANLKSVLLYDDYQTEEDFYDTILASAQQFYKEGLSIHQIKENINQQIQSQLKTSMPKRKTENLTVDQEVLSKIATPEIVKIIEAALQDSRELFAGLIDIKMVYSLALHMETLIERIGLGELAIYPNIGKVMEEHRKEYGVAENIKARLEEEMGITIPDDEVAFIAMFLYSFKLKREGNIQVLVIAHGYSTASNMVEVAKTLLGYDCIHALDMPLEAKVEATLNKAIEQVQRIDKGSGVLLLVDMGSLTTFSDIITEKTGIATKTVKMVSTPMVIEAARKAMMPNMSLDMLVESVTLMSPFIGGRVKVNHPPVEVEPLPVSYQERAGKMLDEILTFLNAKKASQALQKVLEEITESCGQRVDDSLQLKFLFHCSCMIERVIRNEPLPYKNFLHIKDTKYELFSTVKNSFILVEEVFGIAVPDTELAYIVEMLDIHFYNPIAVGRDK